MKTFNASFTSYQQTRKNGLLLVALGIGLIALIAGGMLLGLGDLALALPKMARIILGIGVILLSLAALIYSSRLLLKSGSAESALSADSQTSSSRRLISSASSLPEDSSSPLQEFLSNRLREEARGELENIKTSERLPLKHLKSTGFILAGLFLLLICFLLLNFRATSTTMARLLNPTADIAPWSPLVFTLTPEDSSVIYGDDLSVQAAITGGEIKHPVECLIRDPKTGEIKSLSPLRDSKGRHVRTFKEVVEPFEISFSTGKARSAWKSIDVLLQPLLLTVEAETTPPAYTRKEPLRWEVKGTELKTLRGSLVKLIISSNRPLSGGSLTITQDDGRSQSATTKISGVPVEGNNKQCLFTWEATHSGILKAEVRDILGTACKSPLELTFLSEEDASPTLQLTSPSNYIQATPDAELKLEGYAEDDHGLRKVNLVRALVGLRDRPEELVNSINDADFYFNQDLKLKELGVDPGQSLELYLEGYDHNPNLMGVSTSDIVKVDIISHEDYAQRLRYETTLKQFMARYKAVAKEMKKVRDSLDKLEELSSEGTLEEFQEALKESKDAHESAKKLLDKISEDFQAFDHEADLKAAADEVADALEQNIAHIENFNPEMTRGDYEQVLRQMQNAVGSPMDSMQTVLEDADLLQQVGEVLEKAAEFNRLVESQRSLVTRLSTIAKEVYLGNTQNTAQLKPLALTQERNREALENLTEELAETIKDFPEELAEMKRGTEAFLEKYESLDIPSAMNRASSAARDGQSNTSAKAAILALELMEQLMEEGDNFGEMCQGNMPGSCTGGACEGLGSTMSQLLESLIAQALSRNGMGSKPGSGSSPGGGVGMSPSGFATQGFERQIPVFGPDRLAFESSVKSQSGEGGENGSTPKKKENAVAESNSVRPDEHRDASTADTPEFKVPEKYRQALKVYFTPAE